jgi:tetratricopeptide (TPR) repeat protein
MNLSVQILLKNALELIHAKEIDRAQHLLDKALNASPNNPDIMRFLSVLAAMRFDHAGALELIDKVIALTPDNGVAYSNRGNILKELNRFEEALASLDKATKLC